MKHRRFQLQELSQQIVLINNHNSTQQRWKKASIPTVTPTLGTMIAIGGLAGACVA